MPSPASPFRSTVVVAAGRAVTLVLTLVLGMLSAAYYGTSPEKDSYLVAATVPNLLASVLMGGMYSTLLISLAGIGSETGIFGQIAYARRTVKRLTFVLAPVVLIFLAIPDDIIRFIAPGFPAPQVTLGASLLRITALTAIGTVYFAVIKAIFNAHQQFIVPSLVSILTGLTSVVALLLFVNRLGIFALAIGPLAGTFLALLLLALLAKRFLRKLRTEASGQMPRSDVPPDARRFWATFIALSISANFGKVNLLIDNLFASHLPSGSITMLGFAFIIISYTEFMTVFALAEVALPRLAAAALSSQSELRETFQQNLRYMVLITVPLSTGALVFGLPLVRLLFERGEFSPESTVGVAAILACYSLEIVFMGYFALFWRLLVSRRKLTTIAWSSLAAIALNVIFDYLLIDPFGVNGIAIATPMVTLLLLFTLTPFVRKEVVTIHGPGDGVLLLKAITCAGVMAGVVGAWTVGCELHLDTSKELLRLLEVVGGLSLGGATYAGLLYIMGVHPVRDLFHRLFRAAQNICRSWSSRQG